MAHRGTLFLDEIAELDPMLQAKLLQLLQDGQFSRIGAQEDKKVEVRVVCATNRELHEEIEQGNFRADLFYRIATMTIHLPPLRERAVDLPMICDYLLQYYNEKLNGRAVMVRPALDGQDAALFLAGQYPATGEPGQALRGDGNGRCHPERAAGAQRTRCG